MVFGPGKGNVEASSTLQGYRGDSAEVVRYSPQSAEGGEWSPDEAALCRDNSEEWLKLELSKPVILSKIILVEAEGANVKEFKLEACRVTDRAWIDLELKNFKNTSRGDKLAETRDALINLLFGLPTGVGENIFTGRATRGYGPADAAPKALGMEASSVASMYSAGHQSSDHKLKNARNSYILLVP